jgi:hypothetical protein
MCFEASDVDDLLFSALMLRDVCWHNNQTGLLALASCKQLVEKATQQDRLEEIATQQDRLEEIVTQQDRLEEIVTQQDRLEEIVSASRPRGLERSAFARRR